MQPRTLDARESQFLDAHFSPIQALPSMARALLDPDYSKKAMKFLKILGRKCVVDP